MTDIEKRLEEARNNLLDLSMRNRLLNFRPTKGRTVRVVDEIPREIYDILVLQEKTMGFHPKLEPTESERIADKSGQGLFEKSENDTSDLTEEEASELWKLPSPDAEIAARYVDRFLQTSLESEALQKRLFYINQESRSSLEELGYSILYLAMGFLEWTESPDSMQTRHAPLILIPVELERTKVGMSFKLRWTGEDISTNISLQAMLSQQGISLPDFEMPDDKAGINQYFQSVVTAISIMPKWQVVTDIYLSFFSFTKFVMYKDLDANSWPEGMSPATHPLIQAVLAPSGDMTSEQGFQEDEVDQRLMSRDLYHVMDADPSQIAAIEDVKEGRNLVVEGPPGTGKSQTITNIIAELLAAGKTVLFVSAKMAALEVVKERLDQVGLGNFCLELHSRKSNKKEVLKELEHTISNLSPRAVSLEEEFDQLEGLKFELNGYAKALREPFGKFGRSPFELFCMEETTHRHFTEVRRTMPRIKFDNPENWGQKEWTTAESALANLVEALPLVKPVAEHPWHGCEPGTVLPSDEEDIEGLIDKCGDALSDLEDRIDQLVKISGVQMPTTPEHLPYTVNAAKVVAVSKPVDRNVLLNPEWNKPSKQAEVLIGKVETLKVWLSTTLSKFHTKALDKNIASILEEYKDLSKKFFRLFNGRYRYIRREISALYQGRPPRDAKKIISDLEQLVGCLELREEVRVAEQAGRALFGSHWRGEESDPQLLRAFAEWIVSFRQQLLTEALTEHAVDMVSAGISQEQVEKAADEVAEEVKRFATQRDLLAKRISANYEVIFGTKDSDVPFSDLASHLDLWKAELPKLQRWAQFVSLRNKCLNTVAKPIIEIIESGELEPEDIIPCFEGSFANALLHLVFTERPALAAFIGELHERKIHNFMKLDRELIERNRQRLAYKLYQNQPHISGGASPDSEAGILLGEFGRKRRHMPIRKLMSCVGGLIQKIKPCFMMSPLSIAQFLDPRTARFDVIVFDEASQVRPEDAFGAFLRSSQVVVMGDTHQLPPTTFFDRLVEASESEDQELVTPVSDIESILHLCKGSFPTKLLRWHYRSRHESLIAVSNQQFYDNRLLIYPSSIDKSEYLGLKFIYLPDAVYDRGRSQVNRKEARAVAEAAVEHYRMFPDKSLGIGAFNIKQQQAILEEVELQLRLHPEMEDFFKSDRHEHFFVKNLETIQGDERDVIFLSIGFGFDESGRLTLNFGPLNNDGGERRLNVLITRARERCVVFSNFRASDLSLDGTAKLGLSALKVFLDYAENRNLRSVEATGEDTDSPFEDSVYDFLRSHGYEVRKQVGCAGFRVDLAIVDSQSHGRYLLGVECDGKKYHTSPVARDRDRLRQQILENLGWRIYRVWSTDWYRNRIESQNGLLKAVERARHEEPLPTAIPGEPPSHITMLATGNDLENHSETGESPILHPINDGPVNIVPDYEVCSSLGILPFGELHEQPSYYLAKAVVQVVDIEGPVHFDEVVRRIRSLWGLKRAGQRICDVISNATLLAERRGQIHRRGNFLWTATARPIPVRRRCGDPPAKINLICDEEIAEAVKLVLRHQYATSPKDLIVQSSRLLGIQATSDAVTKRIKTIIYRLLDQGRLQPTPNGMIDFAK